MTTYAVRDIDKLNQVSGIYKFLSKDGDILYIGKAINLKKRLASYFQRQSFDKKIQNLINQITTIETIEVQSEFEALLLEAKLINIHQPKYNVIWKDDKHYIYIKITKDKFPRVLFSRRPQEKGGIYFGPFPAKHIVADLLSYIRTIFPYCTQPPHFKKACFYTHLGLCDPCPAVVKKFEKEPYRLGRKVYLRNIRQIKSLLGGNVTLVKKYLRKQMISYSQNEDYEQAVIFRDKVDVLDYFVQNFHPAQDYIDNPQLSKNIWQIEKKEFLSLLQPYYGEFSKFEKIECYDISNISGKLAAGSMVTFQRGIPDKNFYRRFQIRTKSRPDDFAMLSEIIKRRLNHSEWELPDLFVVDGGKPQLIALSKVFKNYNLEIPIIGLAKEEEMIVIPYHDNFYKLKLPRKSSALHLIQRLRDEAHRFAHRYHQLLRLKYLFKT